LVIREIGRKFGRVNVVIKFKWGSEQIAQVTALVPDCATR
jgi:hypothetical protein